MHYFFVPKKGRRAADRALPRSEVRLFRTHQAKNKDLVGYGALGPLAGGRVAHHSSKHRVTVSDEGLGQHPGSG